jgi:guanylate kinase
MDLTSRLREPSFPIVVSGPSGVGKTVLCRGLLGALPWTRRSVSATTRAPRPNEVDGRSYFFYSPERFERERDAGLLAEWAEVHGHLYGTPRSFLDEQLRSGLSVVLNIDVQGGLSVRSLYADAVLIFVLPPSFGTLEARLRKRGSDGEEEIRHRLARVERELGVLENYDYVIVNGELETAIAELVAIVRAERARVSRRWPGPERDS